MNTTLQVFAGGAEQWPWAHRSISNRKEIERLNRDKKIVVSDLAPPYPHFRYHPNVAPCALGGEADARRQVDVPGRSAFETAEFRISRSTQLRRAIRLWIVCVVLGRRPRRNNRVVTVLWQVQRCTTG